MQTATITTTRLASATYLGNVCGVKLYEDPDYGDEVPMIAVINGKAYVTDFYEVPTEDEMRLALQWSMAETSVH